MIIIPPSLAARLHPPPLSRERTKYDPVLAMRMHPSFANEQHESFASQPRREAERRKAHPTNGRTAHPGVAARTCAGRGSGHSAPARLPALHRGTRQVFQAWLSSGPALHGIGMYDHPSPRAASSSRAGRSASRAGSRSRPGAVCETARGLPRSLRSQDRIRTAPFGERAASPSTDRRSAVKHCRDASDMHLIPRRF
jgi:hypothetical protein